MESLDHPAFFIMSDLAMPTAFALLVEADLQLCVVKTLVSTQANVRISLVHLDMVSSLADLRGLPCIIINDVTVSSTLALLYKTYSLVQSTIHNFLFSGNASFSEQSNPFPGRVCFNGTVGKSTHLSCSISTQLACIATIGCLLLAPKMRRSPTSFLVKSLKLNL